MVGPKGVCATEKDVLSGYKSWSDEFNTDKPPAKPPVQEAGTETQGEKAPPVVEPQPAKQDEGDGMSGGFSGVESGGGTSPGTSVDDAARAFGERERRRSTDVGGRGLISGFGGTGGSKFGSDSLKQETQKTFGGGAGAGDKQGAAPSGTAVGDAALSGSPSGGQSGTPGTGVATTSGSASATPARTAPAPTTTPATPTTAKPAAEEYKWFVWHECDAQGGWWCPLRLSRELESALLRRSQAKKTALNILGVYGSQREAVMATCAKISGTPTMGGEFACGVLAMVGGAKLCVGDFINYDSRTKAWTCKAK